ncbi:putative 1,2-phenylacetyl-CoA epoxidase, subunit D [Streptomyces sp. YIM 130001]|uniref:1,2-phenylacetyl-CoA epoxidase subunit PaaD n=1 Tax=Streptomyces sp. YIM 130001 TaxID=2259644 RepID=UPI000E6568AE|nr:1,2-phenylacetyl-CoA epoxidase subunit PaaD [Streptomyces sp. YIM 130001]RII11266.1 putative 1,2-phenylacetyl-CoA epoxidase, subunit D [Streptomyces sp. YIM 130001]
MVNSPPAGAPPRPTAATHSPLEEHLRALAGRVPDPELPVITLAELGVLRDVRLTSPDHAQVDLTPTYTGCPAIDTMATDIEHTLHAEGITHVTVRTVLAPAWTTDDITPEGRRKLADFGIAPPRPQHFTGPVTVSLGPTRTDAAPLACPHCGSTDTELLSRFSSTACKALRRCLSCREPFDHFKEL